MSSSRMPPRPAQVDPRLDGDDHALAEPARLRSAPTVAGPRVRLESDTVPQAVAEVLPETPFDQHLASRAHRRRSPGLPGAGSRQNRRSPGLVHRGVNLLPLAHRGRRQRERHACDVTAVTVHNAAEVDDHQSRRRANRAVALGRACGSAPCAPAATIVSKAIAVAPIRVRHSYSSRAANCSSVIPGTWICGNDRSQQDRLG